MRGNQLDCDWNEMYDPDNLEKCFSYPRILFEMSTPWPGAKHLDAWTTDCISIDKVNIFHLMIFLQI